MISALNQLVDLVEEHLGEELDLGGPAAGLGTTEYHLRRMFSSLAGMPLSEYVRRRRMTVAAGDVVRGDDDLLEIAVRHGYGSREAFGRAFRAVHGAAPAEVRRDGAPLRTQPQLRFRLTVEGSTPMDTRLVDRPAFRLVGHSTRVPLIHRGVNPHIQQHIAAIPPEEHQRLKALSATEPAGLLQVSDGVDPDGREGTELTYLHGVAVGSGTAVPDGLDVIEVPGGHVGGVPDQRAAPGGSADRLGGDRDRVVPVQPVAAAARALDRRDPREGRRLQHRDLRAVAARRVRVTRRGVAPSVTSVEGRVSGNLTMFDCFRLS